MATSPSFSTAVTNRVRWVGSAVSTAQLEEAIAYAVRDFSRFIHRRRTILLSGDGTETVPLPTALAQAIRLYGEGHACLLEVEYPLGTRPRTFLQSPRDWRLDPAFSSSPTDILFITSVPTLATDNIRVTYKAPHLPVIAAPAISSVVYAGAAGATTFGYRVASVDDYGVTIPGTEVTVANCATPLDATHTNTVTWAANVDAVGGYRVYRSTGGTTGYIAAVAAGTTTYTDSASGTILSATIPTTNTAETTIPPQDWSIIVAWSSVRLARQIAASHAENTNQDGADGVNWHAMADQRRVDADSWQKEGDALLSQRLQSAQAGATTAVPEMLFRQLTRRYPHRNATNWLNRQGSRVR